MNRKVAMAMLIAVVMVGLVSSCNSFVDVKVKHDYTLNKVIIITAMIEQYRADHGAYPEKLQDIRGALEQYAKTHPEVMRRYLYPLWQEAKIDWFVNGTRYHIWYICDQKQQKYYLYTSYGIRAKKPLSERALKDYAGKVQVDIYLVCNGDLIGGPCSHLKGISVGNMVQSMHPLEYKGHQLYF